MMKGSMSTELGIITISPEVIAKYAGSVAVECFGIVGMAAVNMKDGLVRLLKRESLTHGIHVDISDENILVLDFHVIVAYGVNILSVSDNLMNNVKYKVEEFTGMKIEKINENKIKVLIDIDEAKEWNVNIKNIASNTPEIQEMFWTALRLAEKDVEFSVDGAKLFVEAIPGQTEGFGMLITKIFSDNDLNLAVSNCSYKGRVKKRKLTPGRNECIKRALGKRIFRFCDFENVCQAASAVYRDFEGESTLYKLEDSYYMLLLPTDSSSIIGIEKVMLEFSDKQSKTLISHGRLNELGEIMIKENAVNILSEYFS